MVNLDKHDVLNLYLLLSDEGNLSERFNRILVKLEHEIFDEYSVNEIETYRSIFIEKGKV